MRVKLQQLREANGYTQQAFSAAVGISRSHYSQVETGEKQQEENEQAWGLVLVLPKEVQEATQHLGHKEFRNKKAEDEITGMEFQKGLRDGREFDPAKRLEA